MVFILRRGPDDLFEDYASSGQIGIHKRKILELLDKITKNYRASWHIVIIARMYR